MSYLPTASRADATKDAIYEALPHGQLAVIPGASHVLPMEKPALVNQLIREFLESGEPETYLPLRRSPAH